MKNHLIKEHDNPDGDQECYLMRIEGAYAKGYWLYVDMPISSTLASLDKFLRKIWLECCGHMSAFYGASRRDELGGNRRLGFFSIGDKLNHDYDFGTTTSTLATIVGETTRKKQKESVRLLARNIPPAFICESCGEPASVICTECIYDTGNPFLCDDCAEEHEHEDMTLPVTNSPRMGDCGYEGESDIYAFIPKKRGKHDQ